MPCVARCLSERLTVKLCNIIGNNYVNSEDE